MKQTMRRGALLLTCLAVLGLAGCTGDGGDESVVFDDGSAAEVVAAAFERAATSSGKIHLSAEFDDPASGLGGGVDIRFAGDDMDLSMSLAVSYPDMGSEDPPGPDLRMLEVDGRSYLSAATYGLSPTGGTALPEDIDWVDVTDSTTSDGMDDALRFPTTQQIFASFDDLADVTEADAVTIDGEQYRSFSGVVSMSAAKAFVDGESVESIRETVIAGEDEEWIARYDANVAYGEEHSSVGVTVLVDEAGNLRQLTLVLSSDVPEEHADCFALADMLGDGRVVLDLTHVGEVTIEAPDPATVISESDAEQLLTSALGDSAGPAGVAETFPTDLLVAGVQFHAPTLGIDPAAVAEMGEGELLDLVEQLPQLETALGTMSRPGLLAHVRTGMQMEGVDPAMADTLTDEQLGQLIDAYLESDAMAGPDEGDSYDEFEGCPA